MFLTRDVVGMIGCIGKDTPYEQESGEKSNEHMKTKRISLKDLQNMTIEEDNVRETTRSQRNDGRSDNILS